MTVDTIPKQLRENAHVFGDKIALREKRFGIWQSISWKGYFERVRNFALGLHELGFERGDRIVIIGDNRPEWVISELSAQSLGGASIGIYQDSVVEEVAYIVQLVDAKFIIVEDQEQVDKLIEMRDQLSTVKNIIYYDPKGLRNYQEAYLKAFPDVEKLGVKVHQREPNLFEMFVDMGKSDDIAIISTTSGTTANPKLAKITHYNLMATGRGWTAIDKFQQSHEYVSFLPLAWIGEQMIAVACGMSKGFALNFPEEPETVQQDIREIGPNIMFAPPRIWENMLSQVQVKIEDADFLKKWMFNWAIQVGTKLANLRFNQQEAGLLDRIQGKIAYYLVFLNLLDQLGLLHIKWAYTGGAALGPRCISIFPCNGCKSQARLWANRNDRTMCYAHR